MGKLAENLFGARKAAGYKDRCVHADSKKYVERESALLTQCLQIGLEAQSRLV